MIDAIEYPDGATPLDADELEGLRHQHVTTTSQLNHLEQANIQDGLIWLAREKDVEVLDEEFIRELHQRLFGEVWDWAGRFRKTEKNLGVDPLTIGLALKDLLDDARYWIEHETY